MTESLQAAPVLERVQLDLLLHGLDEGVKAHLAWNQRLLRCSLLRESPGDDMRSADAHRLCQFGLWFQRERAALDQVNAALVARVDAAHADMHGAVARLCEAVLHGQAARPEDLQAYEASQLAMLGSLATLRDQVVMGSATKDVLTGLPLRHGLEYLFEVRQRDARRQRLQLYVVMVDADRFKSINDRWGHLVGDAALLHLSQALRLALRESDALLRFGGEEFLALLLLPDLASAQVATERVRQTVEGSPFLAQPGQEVWLTVTLGVACAAGYETLPSVIARADHALLEGKLHGRNRVVVAASQPALDPDSAEAALERAARLE